MLELLNDTTLNDQQVSLLNSAIASAQSLSALVSDILDMQSLMKNSLTLNNVNVSMLSVLHAIRHNFFNVMQERKLLFNCFFPNSSSAWMFKKLLLDETRFTQIIMALLSNAFKVFQFNFVFVYKNSIIMKMVLLNFLHTVLE